SCTPFSSYITSTIAIYTLSLHDALPIYGLRLHAQTGPLARTSRVAHAARRVRGVHLWLALRQPRALEGAVRSAYAHGTEHQADAPRDVRDEPRDARTDRDRERARGLAGALGRADGPRHRPRGLCAPRPRK